jgi:PhzF family phenazine biosynthesis protein
VLKVFAFASPEGGGNPAGVVLDGDGLEPAKMQRIATQAGMSETAFVSRRAGGAPGYRLDFFTPTTRIADCGHATVAAFAVLAQQDPSLRESIKEIDAGTREIRIQEGRVFMEQPLPVLRDLPDSPALAARLLSDTEPGTLATAARGAWLARHDVGFVLLELANEQALAALRPNLQEIHRLSRELDLVGIYAFVPRPAGPIAATTRMFAPAYGIDEESATGMAAGLLTGLLATRPAERRIWVGGTGRF